MEKFLEYDDYTVDGELTVTITLAEYRELVRVSTLYEQEHPLVKRPLLHESIGEGGDEK